MLLMLLSKGDDDSNENVKNKKKLVYHGKPQICTSITFLLYVFLPSLHDYSVKMPNFTFYGGRKQATKNFFFLFLNLSAVAKKSTPGKFSYM